MGTRNSANLARVKQHDTNDYEAMSTRSEHVYERQPSIPIFTLAALAVRT